MPFEQIPLLATTEILISSAMPLRIWSSGRVFRNEKSRITRCDAWKAPSRFFSFPWLTATLIATLASISPISVVGTRM